jgi:acetyltransferase AlgX (SGNH hydrolase-like protein)
MSSVGRNERLLTGGRVLSALRQAAIIAAITIVLCEIGLRAFNAIHPLPFFYTSSYNRFRVKPHAVFYGFPLNSRGFNDVEFKFEKTPGTFRVLGVGDSFAFGVVPYPFNYLTVIEERLNANAPRLELINMGIPGVSPREYLALLIHEGLELKPDMVLLTFFVGNDFTEPTKVARLYRHSYLASLGKYLYDLKTKMANIDYTPPGNYDDEGGLFTPSVYIEYERSMSGIFRRDSKSFASQFANAVDHLGNIKRMCDAHGIRLVVVLAPDAMQVDFDLQQQVIQASGVSSAAFDFDLPNNRLRDELGKRRIDHIDLLDRFRDAGKGARLYRPNDTHWNIRGNALAAELILRHLQPQLPPVPKGGATP